MRITADKRDELNRSFNESRITGFSIDRELKRVSVVFETVCMNEDGTIPEDTRVVISFINVCRLAGILKLVELNNETFRTESFQPEELNERLLSYNGESMYGWEFINVENPDLKFEEWQSDSSFDVQLIDCPTNVNTIDIFSEHFSSECKSLDIRIWFEKIEIESLEGEPISTQEFIDRGTRGWNAIFKGNNRMTKAYGIVASSNDSNKSLKHSRQLKKSRDSSLRTFWSWLTGK